MQICMDLRHSKRVFGLSALAGYFVVVGLLLLFRAPLEVILGVSVLLAISTFRVIRDWPPRPPQPRFGGKGTRQAGVILPLVIVALSPLLTSHWRGNPPGFLPNAGGLMLSAVAFGFILFVASWFACWPSGACPACVGRVPLS